MKSPYTCVYRELWDDPRFIQLSEAGKLVYLYILTTPMGNGLGCFRAGKAAMVEESGFKPEWFNEGYVEGFSEGLSKGLFRYDAKNRVVYIPKYFLRNSATNPNTLKSLSREYNKLPNCKLKHECYLMLAEWIDTKAKPFAEVFKELYEEPFIEPFAEPFKEPLLEPLEEPFVEPLREPSGTNIPIPIPIPIPSPIPDPIPIPSPKPIPIPKPRTRRFDDISTPDIDAQSLTLEEQGIEVDKSNSVTAVANRILRYWPKYGEEFARVTAAKLVCDERFADLNLSRLLGEAHTAWPPNRDLFSRNGLHGYLTAFASNAVKSSEKQQKSMKTKAEMQRDRNAEILDAAEAQERQ